MKTSNVYHKHLNLSKRIQIEQGLNENKSFVEKGYLDIDNLDLPKKVIY